jgi:serine protease Do
MPTWLCRAAIPAALIAALLGGAGTPTRADYSRRTPIVEAVQKTRHGIVTIKVEKKGNWGRKEVVGAGVIVDERGYVVTNRHVVAAADRILVKTADNIEYLAQIQVEDARHDLAVLRLPDAKKLQALAFAPSSDLMVGETVIAIGNPFGYANSVSTGIVSALNREIKMPTDELLTGLIQTTASINPGNSGGPLLNVNGELIGINVALREGAQGIAFALSSDMVQQVLSKHLSAAKVGRVAHGLTCRELVGNEGEPRQRVIVDAVMPDSPAYQAGLRRGDVLVRLAGRVVRNRFDVERAFWSYQAGEKVEATVLRDGREAQTIVALARAEGGIVTAAVEKDAKSKGTAGKGRPVNDPR